MLKAIFVCFMGIVVSSCSSTMQLDTNIHPEKIKQAFMPSLVKIYKNQAALPQNHRYLGLVEGESCQQKVEQPVATTSEAKIKARYQALNINANAVIFTSCLTMPNEQCISNQVCYGQAFLTE